MRFRHLFGEQERILRYIADMTLRVLAKLLLLIATGVILVLTWPSIAPSDSPKIRLQPFLRNLDMPVLLTNDGTRTFVVQQTGKILLVIDGKIQKQPYLDISDRLISGGEMGLLGLAFHPKFAENGRLFVNYTARRPGLKSFVSEFHADPKSMTADAGSEKILLWFDQPFPNHNGGMLCFGQAPGALGLFIGTGDGGSANDPYDNGQNINAWLGKILRIDVDSEIKPYGIPKDNPFATRKDARPEIFAWGLRNPWRFSVDRETGDIWAADVGQNLWEEIDIITNGGNYGWRLREGMHPFQPTKNQPPLVDPIKEYPHEVGLSVTGGYVYRGKAIPSLVGWYLYGDYSSGRIWGLKRENGRIVGDVMLLRERVQPSSFGEDAAGEMYLLDYNGTIYKIVSPQ